METRLHIRTALDADIPALAGLVERYWAFEGIEGFSLDRVARNLQLLVNDSRLGTAWVAVDQDALCGYLIVARVFSLEHGGVMAEIDELFVQPQRRGRGVGEQLLLVAESQLAADGCVRMQLQLGRNNRSGRRFYRRLGYEERSAYEFLDKPLSAG